MEESSAWQFAFEINWSLTTVKLQTGHGLDSSTTMEFQSVYEWKIWHFIYYDLKGICLKSFIDGAADCFYNSIEEMQKEYLL